MMLVIINGMGRYATAKEVDNITIGMKEIYRALRDRDVEVDLAIDAQVRISPLTIPATTISVSLPDIG